MLGNISRRNKYVVLLRLICIYRHYWIAFIFTLALFFLWKYCRPFVRHSFTLFLANGDIYWPSVVHILCCFRIVTVTLILIKISQAYFRRVSCELYCLMHFLYSHLVATRQTPCCNEHIALELMGLEQRWPNSRSRPTSRSRSICLVHRGRFFLKHNWRCKLGMHELSSAERNARYRRFFELINNPPDICQVILNLLSVNYRKIRSVMHQLHNRKVSEKYLLIMINCFTSKYTFWIK
jgi:hypothetical protein